MSQSLLLNKKSTGVKTPNGFYISGNTIYGNDSANVFTYNLTTGALISSGIITSVSYSYRIYGYGSDFYITFGSVVNKYPNSGGASTGNISLPIGTYGLYITSTGIIYIGTYGTASVYAYNASNLTALSGFTTVVFSGNTAIINLTVANNIIYAADSANNRISTANATTGAVINNSFITGITGLVSIDIMGNDLYVATGTNVKIYNATTGALVSTYYTPTSTISDMRVYNNILYIADGNSINFYTVIPYPCFRQGTKILSVNPASYQEEYVPVETLKPGDLIKTSESGYKEIHSIGYRTISLPKSDSNPSNRLYKFSHDAVFEPLYITGEHCTLHRDLPKEKLDEVEKHMERIHVTENHYRVPAMLDDRAEPYDLEDEPTTIWHFALDHEDVTFNYGVYANGLLVESCAIESLKEKSGMQLLE